MKKDECGTIFFLALGLFYLILSFDYNAGTMANPQEGFFPILTGVLMVFFSAWALFSSLKNRSKSESLSAVWSKLDLRNLFSVLMVLGCVSLYLVILNYVGFLLSSPPLLFTLTWIMGGKNLIVNAVISIVTSALIYWAFWIIMRIPIPIGTFFLH
jgi:putative tricarboxylic transport membrane protein